MRPRHILTALHFENATAIHECISLYDVINLLCFFSKTDIAINNA